MVIKFVSVAPISKITIIIRLECTFKIQVSEILPTFTRNPILRNAKYYWVANFIVLILEIEQNSVFWS